MVYDASFAIGIKDDGARFLTGIVFGAESLTDYGGFSYAMRLAKGHMVQWHDASDAVSANITSTISTAAHAQFLQFQDGGTVIGAVATGNFLFGVEQVSAVNGIQVQPGAAGNPVNLAAVGADTNIELNLTPKGSGAVYAAGPFFAGSTFYAAGNATFNGTLTVSSGAASLQAVTATSGIFIGAVQVNGGLVLTGGGGATVRSGAGAASGIQPKGSLWLRSDGGIGSTVYVSQGGGTWNAVAGV